MKISIKKEYSLDLIKLKTDKKREKERE